MATTKRTVGNIDANMKIQIKTRINDFKKFKTEQYKNWAWASIQAGVWIGTLSKSEAEMFHNQLKNE